MLAQTFEKNGSIYILKTVEMIYLRNQADFFSLRLIYF